MSHKYESSAVLCCCIQTVIICRFYCLCRDCFCNGLFVLVDYGSVTSNLAKQRLCDGYGLKFILVAIYCFFQLSDSEAVLLAGIPNAPSAYAPSRHADLALQREKQVLAAMVKYGYLEPSETDSLLWDAAADPVLAR